VSETVNGYLCRDCADVALAKRGVDPAHPKRNEEVRRTEAAVALGLNQPSAAGSSLGARLNLYA
jgi:hypothetical protein